MDYKLTFVDTVSVQNYIFGSNILTHIIGASELVRKTTNDWVFSNLLSLGKSNVDAQGVIDKKVRFPDPELKSELIYAGGGNALILFPEGQEKLFAKRFCRHVLLEAPGLDMIIVHETIEFDPETGKFPDFREKIKAVMEKAGAKKQDRQLNGPLQGIGFTVICPYSGKPAVGREPHTGVRISSEIIKKISAEPEAEARLSASFGEGRIYFKNFDAIQGDRKGAYIAVVHSDGTDMGKRIENVLNKTDGSKDFCVDALRNFSDSIKEASKSAMRKTIDQLADGVTQGKIKAITEFVGNEDTSKEKRECLPIRPIVFGGDDITFVCEGILGLALGAYHLQQLQKEDLSDHNPIYGRTGVAVVKSHFPFSQAYQLAEALSHSARHAAKISAKNDIPPAMIDWFFSSSGPVLDLARIRDKKYMRQLPGYNLDLMMRPVVVWGDFEGPFEKWRTWDVFSGLVGILNGKDYQDKHSKLKSLLSVLPDNRDAFQLYLKKSKLEMPKVPKFKNLAEDGWDGSRSLYHDALEAMDFYWEI